jgi:hypothetical protein
MSESHRLGMLIQELNRRSAAHDPKIDKTEQGLGSTSVYKDEGCNLHDKERDWWPLASMLGSEIQIWAPGMQERNPFGARSR